MPVQPTYPGVYIDEIPSGVRTIVGVSTSITAFIGRALRGDVDTPVVINGFGDFERQFGGLWLQSALGYAVRDFFLNGGGQAIIVRVANTAAQAALDLPTGAGALPAVPVANDRLPLLAESPGAWGSNLSATVDYNTRDTTDSDLFNLTITEKEPGTNRVLNQEKFLNVSINPVDATYLPGLLAKASSLVAVKTDGSGNPIIPNVRPTATTSAASVAPVGTSYDGIAVGSKQILGNPGDKTGMYALEKADLFNLMVIPPYTSGGDVENTVWIDAGAYCEIRRAFLLVDPPTLWTNKAAAVTGISATGVGTTSKNSAVFFPRVLESNPLHANQLEPFVPSGAIAGVFARTDVTRGVWKAPAGLDATLVGAAGLTVSLTDKENGELNPLGVNCLRSFPIIGRVSWGARTLQGADIKASEWKYIPVRRTALFLEESLYRGTQWVVFEPNDEPLWAQIRLNIGAFMQSLFRQGAFQGQSPKEAYFVKCDKETTTQDDINKGIVNIVVGFAPLKPAEFVIIHLQQMAGQIAV